MSRTVALLLPLLLLASCSGRGSGGSEEIVLRGHVLLGGIDPAGPALAGVALPGVSRATLQAYDLAPGGGLGPSRGSTITGADGSYELRLPKAGWTVLSAVGGIYWNPAQQRAETLGAPGLCLVVNAQSRGQFANLSAWGDVARTLGQQNEISGIPNAYEAANFETANFLGISGSIDNAPAEELTAHSGAFFYLADTFSGALGGLAQGLYGNFTDPAWNVELAAAYASHGAGPAPTAPTLPPRFVGSPRGEITRGEKASIKVRMNRGKEAGDLIYIGSAEAVRIYDPADGRNVTLCLSAEQTLTLDKKRNGMATMEVFDLRGQRHQIDVPVFESDFDPETMDIEGQAGVGGGGVVRAFGTGAHEITGIDVDGIPATVRNQTSYLADFEVPPRPAGDHRVEIHFDSSPSQVNNLHYTDEWTRSFPGAGQGLVMGFNDSPKSTEVYCYDGVTLTRYRSTGGGPVVTSITPATSELSAGGAIQTIDGVGNIRWTGGSFAVGNGEGGLAAKVEAPTDTELAYREFTVYGEGIDRTARQHMRLCGKVTFDPVKSMLLLLRCERTPLFEENPEVVYDTLFAEVAYELSPTGRITTLATPGFTIEGQLDATETTLTIVGHNDTSLFFGVGFVVAEGNQDLSGQWSGAGAAFDSTAGASGLENYAAYELIQSNESGFDLDSYRQGTRGVTDALPGGVGGAWSHRSKLYCTPTGALQDDNGDFVGVKSGDKILLRRSGGDTGLQISFRTPQIQTSASVQGTYEYSRQSHGWNGNDLLDGEQTLEVGAMHFDGASTRGLLAFAPTWQVTQSLGTTSVETMPPSSDLSYTFAGGLLVSFDNAGEPAWFGRLGLDGNQILATDGGAGEESTIIVMTRAQAGMPSGGAERLLVGGTGAVLGGSRRGHLATRMNLSIPTMSYDETRSEVYSDGTGGQGDLMGTMSFQFDPDGSYAASLTDGSEMRGFLSADGAVTHGIRWHPNGSGNLFYGITPTTEPAMSMNLFSVGITFAFGEGLPLRATVLTGVSRTTFPAPVDPPNSERFAWLRTAGAPLQFGLGAFYVNETFVPGSNEYLQDFGSGRVLTGQMRCGRGFVTGPNIFDSTLEILSPD